MFTRLVIIVCVAFCLAANLSAQTTAGVMTGVITDSTGAVLPGVQVTATNTSTSESRTAITDGKGYYIILQVPPGVYNISVAKGGFATEKQSNVGMEVNQSLTLNFKLPISATTQTVTVTEAPPALNTTSSTLSTVVNHQTTVDLPLNGREFTQLALLTPGAAPVENLLQGILTVPLGAGGISPSVNGQKGDQNNFTMDGTLNNSLYTNVWAIAPPPDAIQEFNVQSHITDAQFAVSSGANINVVTRSGTNDFHGALWEFVRNDALDAQTFPETQRLPYTQNQYGFYLGGPVTIPRLFHGKNNTWFSGYWEGFRSYLSQTQLASILTPAMIRGDFSGVLGPQVGTDSLGRPEYANEIYDPLTSRPDPQNPGAFLRDPFPGNIIPANRLNPSTLGVIQKYYNLTPNLNVAEGVLPNYQFTAQTSTLSDVFGVRMDHKFSNNDTVFLRLNRSNAHALYPEALPGYSYVLSNFANQAAVGYTHLFDPNTILQLHYGYTYANPVDGDQPAGSAFADSINFSLAQPPQYGVELGPAVSLSNGYSGVNQIYNPLGPTEGHDYHLDFSKTIGGHTISAGGMFYHIYNFEAEVQASTNFTQNATAQDAVAGPTGFGPASFLLGTLDSYSGWFGRTGINLTTNWYGIYAQDQWQATKRLVITAGLRWDYVTPPNFHTIFTALDALTGKLVITGAVPPHVPVATGRSTYYVPRYNGFEPRFGITFQAANRTVLHSAFAILDDHNNTLVQEGENVGTSWPYAATPFLTSLDLGIPQMYLNNLPAAATFYGPQTPPVPGQWSGNPNNKIPYAIEYNAGIQQQLSQSLSMKLDYVGSQSRHQYIAPLANTPMVPGPGPIQSRAPQPLYSPVFYSWNEGPGNYNALQAFVQKSLSSGLLFMASYTYSKSMDINSDPYTNSIPNFYDMASNYGPSNYSLKHMFVLSTVYALPIGRGKTFLSNPNRVIQAVAGNWNIGGIVSLHSGQPFNALAGADVANVGTGFTQHAQRTGANPYASKQSYTNWLNPAAFTSPAPYTFGNESRNDLTGPSYRDVDVNAYKDFPIGNRATLQFRSEFFNVLNSTNYAKPVNNIQSSAFGQIVGAAGPGRQIQFAAKLVF